jgi:hypothetical protein
VSRASSRRKVTVLPEKWAGEAQLRGGGRAQSEAIGDVPRRDRLGEDLAEQLLTGLGQGDAARDLEVPWKVMRLPEAAEAVVVAMTSKPRVVRTRAWIRSEP